MKLYLLTEEQLDTMLYKARLHKQDDTEMFTNEYLLSQETPIELPSDEDINKESFQRFTFPMEILIFQLGASFVKEQILNQNK